MILAATAADRPTAAAAAAASLADSARRIDSGSCAVAVPGIRAPMGELVDRFSGYVYAIVGCFDLNGDRAQDAYHDVFTRVYPRLDTLADPGALKSWIAQLARRGVLDRLRLDARELPSDASTFELAAERDLTEIELAMVVREALDCLDEPFREVIGAASSQTRATARSARRRDCRLAPWRRASRAVW